MKPIIREETLTDIDPIELLTIEAFKSEPYSEHTEQFIIKALRAAGALTLSLIAELEGNVVGHVAVSPVKISNGATDWFGLGPLSVAPKYQRKGVGSELMKCVLGMLKEQGAGGCVLLGDPNYYGRFGFKARSELVLPNVPAEYFQSILLNRKMAEGIVNYHPAFNAKS